MASSEIILFVKKWRVHEDGPPVTIRYWRCDRTSINEVSHRSCKEEDIIWQLGGVSKCCHGGERGTPTDNLSTG